ncbi:unnamed protein product [Polarella glacialis]|uniref:Uncharacterized protein n=1 Tax=Polarella glacialis TaxID=89957 RepID=A0A813HH21_POLGL|nr:unnamed protein product [Polarella glacialis]
MAECEAERVIQSFRRIRGPGICRYAEPARDRRGDPSSTASVPNHKAGFALYLGSLLVMAYVTAVANSQAPTAGRSGGLSGGGPCPGTQLRGSRAPLLVCSHCAMEGSLLRPGEMLQLTRRAVRLPDDLLTIGMLAVLIIEAPNNRRRVGKRQFVLIKNGVTVDWLRWLVLPLKPGQGPFLAPERLW